MKRIYSTTVVLLLLLIHAGAQENDFIRKSWDGPPDDQEEFPFYLWNQMITDPFVKQHYGFKIAFCQHPMYLLIDEDRGDPPVGERIPPWGATTSNEYVERVKRNLGSLERFPDIKLNYQWSAVELDHMLDKHPDVYQTMRDLHNRGKLDFLDGTYSQAHLQVLGSESNWRQFEYGLEIYRDRLGKDVDVYSRQETGLHLQLPQLLKAFGYHYMTIPAFHSIINITGGSLEIMNNKGNYGTLAGQEFVIAEALDGTGIPAYLWMRPGEWVDRTDQFEMDLYSGPKIFYWFPDLEEVNEEDYLDYKDMYDWVLLGYALDDRLQAAPPTASASIYSYWSYVEGVWAEELMRANKLAEEEVLLAEQMQAMGSIAGIGMDKSLEIKTIWKEILKSQHHDISWIEVTDLRRKSIARLQSSNQDSRGIMEAFASELVTKDPSSMAIFNGLPRERDCLVQLEAGNSLSGIQFQGYNGVSTGFATIPAGGFMGFKESGKSAPSVSGRLPGNITSESYSVELDEEGLIRQITVGEKELLATGNYLGGEMKARIAGNWVDNREARIRYFTGPVFDVVERETTLGHIPVQERYYYYKERPLIRVELEFEFDGDEVGNMWMDNTKINTYYPTQGNAVHHDIPFGYLEARQDRPIFATNWVHCGGIVYVNRGTLKHRVQDGVIANVLAWGSRNFSNRLHWDYWTTQNQYDIRLYGKQKVEYFIIPVGEFDGNRIVQDVTDLVSPVFVTPGSGEKSYYKAKNELLAPTAIYEKDGEVWIRGYQLPGGDQTDFRDFEILNIPVVNK